MKNAALDFKKIRYIPGLDGVRFIAVSIVMISHFGLGKLVPGGFGVTIFFFLSGFLITTILAQEISQTETVSIGYFYIRRFLRLSPELLLFLALAIAIDSYVGSPPKAGDILSALTYTTNYYIIYLQNISPNGTADFSWGHLWSLAVEEHYYITFPLVLIASINQRRFLTLFFLLALLGCLLWRCYVAGGGIDQRNWNLAYGYLASEARYDSIAYGAAFSLMCQNTHRISPFTSKVSFCSGLFLILVSLAIRDEFFRETVRYSVQGIGLTLIFSHLYLSHEVSPIVNILEKFPMKWGGRLSYGAYLWHLEVNDNLNRIIQTSFPQLEAHIIAITEILGFPITFSLAWLSYQFVAKPFLVLRRKYSLQLR